MKTLKCVAKQYRLRHVVELPPPPSDASRAPEVVVVGRRRGGGGREEAEEDRQPAVADLPALQPRAPERPHDNGIVVWVARAGRRRRQAVGPPRPPLRRCRRDNDRRRQPPVLETHPTEEAAARRRGVRIPTALRGELRTKCVLRVLQNTTEHFSVLALKNQKNLYSSR